MVDAASLKRPSEFLPAVGWIAWPGRSQVRLRGADRAKFLHNFCTNDIKKLQPGQGCEAFLTSIKGRILGHLFVFAGESELMIDTVPGEDVKIRDHLDRYLITEDAQIDVVTDAFQSVYIFGREAASRVHDLFGFDVSALAVGNHIENAGSQTTLSPGFVRRLDLTSEPGFEIGVAVANFEAFASELMHGDRGAPQPVLIAPGDFDGFRIDSGFPTYGIDLTEDHLAQEAARTDRAISFTKGCYLGQEPIARIDALGHVNRELRLVAFEAGTELSAPVKILNAATGADVGTLTSVGHAGGSVTVGLGMLKTAAVVGTEVFAAETQLRGIVVSAASGL